MTQSRIPPVKQSAAISGEKLQAPAGGNAELWVVIGILLFLVALGCIVGGVFAMAEDSDVYDRSRFATDNAYGASANALEKIARHPPHPAAPWSLGGLLCLISALLCFLIFSVERLRTAVLARRE